MPTVEPTDTLAAQGMVWARRAIPRAEVERLCTCVPTNSAGTRLRLTDLGLHGSALEFAIAKHWPDYRVVRAVAFSKSPDRNWTLPWHQDRVIAVQERVEVKGFKNWSFKAGVWHCEPPETILNSMIFVRVLLDDVGEDDGGMRVAIGSHNFGIIASEDTKALADAAAQIVEVGRAGDILALNMLTLHRSSASGLGRPRRILRLDLASEMLPEPLRWAA